MERSECKRKRSIIIKKKQKTKFTWSKNFWGSFDVLIT